MLWKWEFQYIDEVATRTVRGVNANCPHMFVTRMYPENIMALMLMLMAVKENLMILMKR
jgi:hypothetical protein